MNLTTLTEVSATKMAYRVFKDMNEFMDVLTARRLVNATVYVACETSALATAMASNVAHAMPSAPRPIPSRVGDLFVTVYGTGTAMDHFMLYCREGYVLSPQVFEALCAHNHPPEILHVVSAASRKRKADAAASAAPAAAAATATAAPATAAPATAAAAREADDDFVIATTDTKTVNRMGKMESDAYFKNSVKKLQNASARANKDVIELAKIAVQTNVNDFRDEIKALIDAAVATSVAETKAEMQAMSASFAEAVAASASASAIASATVATVTAVTAETKAELQATSASVADALRTIDAKATAAVVAVAQAVADATPRYATRGKKA